MALHLDPDRAALSISKWLDAEITPKIDSWWKKGLSDLLSVSILRNGKGAIESAMPVLKAMHLVDEDGKVDMDELAAILHTVMDRQSDGKMHATSIGLVLDKSDITRLMSVAAGYAPPEPASRPVGSGTAATTATPNTAG